MADSRYRQIAQDLMRKIDSGALRPGQQLPNEEGLKTQYTASRNTVRDAIKFLVTRGIVETRAGQGTFVKEPIEAFVTTLYDPNREPEAGMVGGEGAAAFDEIIMRQLQKMSEERVARGLSALTEDQKKLILENLPLGELDGEDPFQAVNEKRTEAGLPPLTGDQRKLILENLPLDTPDARPPTIEVQRAQAWVAERLRIDAGARVIVRHQEFYVGTTPWSLQTTFYPMQLATQRGATALLEPDDIKEGTVKYLREQAGLVQCGSRLRILVRSPNDHEARFFRMPDDGRISVTSLIRTGYEDTPDSGPYPFRVTFTVLPGDRNQFVVNVGKVPVELASPARDQ